MKATEMETRMKINTRQFGDLEFTEDLVITFPKGIIGFEDTTRFLIVHDEEYEPFRWLISIDDKEIGFPILNPFLVQPEYGKELPRSYVKRILSSEENWDIFCVVTLKGEGGKVTINLKSPIVVNYQEKSGEQLILTSEELQVAKPIS